MRPGGNRRTRNAGSIARLARAVLLSGALALGGCGGMPTINFGPGPTPQAAAAAAGNGMPGYIKGFLGGVAADEPSAALVGREVLSAGGTAADAAVAVGFALAVTLPSRAGLGGGGACLAYAPTGKGPSAGVPQAVLFVTPAPSHPGAADRPAAVPMLARGLFLLHAQYGNRRFESLLGPAEQMARGGVTVSRSLAHDLAVVARPLARDPAARATFFVNGAPIAEGAHFVQPGMAATLAQLRRFGVGDLYQGQLAHILTTAAGDAGAGLAVEDLRAALPHMAPALLLPAGDDRVAFLPPPADGGLAAAAAFQALRQAPAAIEAAGWQGLAVASRWRQGGGDPAALLQAAATLPAATLPPLPASTAFAVLDRQGAAVVCALTMNNLFGTGRVAAGTGILLAASPAMVPPPLLAAALAYSPRRHAFRAVVGAAGQDGASLAAALAMTRALADAGPVAHPNAEPVPAPGRADVIACPGYVPGRPQSCGWAADPRGSGLAVGQAVGAGAGPEAASPGAASPDTGVPGNTQGIPILPPYR